MMFGSTKTQRSTEVAAALPSSGAGAHDIEAKKETAAETVEGGVSTSTGTPIPSSNATDSASTPVPRSLERKSLVFLSPGGVRAATSWKEAHRAFCAAHGTLRASLRDVLNEACDENQEIPWELPSRRGGSLATTAADVADLLQPIDPVNSSSSSGAATTGSGTSSKTSWLSSLVTSFLYFARKDGDDDDDEDWVQEKDDAFRDEGDRKSSTSSSAPDLAVPIVNIEMTKSSLEELQEMIQIQATAAGTSPYILVARSDWTQWIASTTEANPRSILSTIPASDKEFLLQVLEEKKQARIVVRKRDAAGLLDVIVLSPTAMPDQDSSDNSRSKSDPVEFLHGTIPDYLQVHVALWDISRMELSIEKQIEEWSKRVTDCNRKALQYKRMNQKSLAVNQLAKRKVIQQRIDSSSMALLKLEQSKSAIETAQSNKMVLEHMRASTKVLKDLRIETPLEEIEDAQDDWQAEYDTLQETLESFSAMAKVDGNRYDDDELLKELENLTLDEESSSREQFMPPPPPQPSVLDKEISNLETRLAGLSGPGNSSTETIPKSAAPNVK
jgi:Snf7